jgi:hypothetical protein
MNKKQTDINAVEYISSVNQFAEKNNTDKPKQQTAVEWFAMKLAEKLGMPNAISFYVDNQKEILQAKEMEKEQRSIEVPSDEEIDYAETQMPMNTFELGAKWMRNKIQGGKQ